MENWAFDSLNRVFEAFVFYKDWTDIVGLDIVIILNPLYSLVTLVIQGTRRLEKNTAIGFGINTTQLCNGHVLLKFSLRMLLN